MSGEEKEPSIEDIKKLLGIPTKKTTFSLQGVSSSSSSPAEVDPPSQHLQEEVKEKEEEEEESKKSSESSPYVPPPPPPNSDVPARRYRLGWSRDDSDDEEERQEFESWKEPETLEEKRKLYRCGKDFVALHDIPTWADYGVKNKILIANQKNIKYPANEVFNSKISIFNGDITTLEIDGVVNAANRSLLGGGGIDGAIHRAAGRNLLYECRRLNGCSTGFTKVTRGYNLPSKYILHTVGPTSEDKMKLRSCYRTCLEKVLENNMKSVAFCCVATGIFGFPLQAATHIALDESRKFIEKNHEKVERIIFCVFLKIEKEMYEYFLPWYFPLKYSENENSPGIQKNNPPKKKKWWESSSEEED